MRLSRRRGQVTHVLLTRSPLIQNQQKPVPSPFDLHVLSTPPAFVLSQDQTLRTKNKARKRTTHPPPNTTRGTSGRPQPKNSKTKTGTKTKQTVDKQTHYRVHKQHPHKPEAPPQQDRTTGQAQPPRTTPRRQVNNLPTHTHHVKSNPGEPDHTRSSPRQHTENPQPTPTPPPANTPTTPPPPPTREHATTSEHTHTSDQTHTPPTPPR